MLRSGLLPERISAAFLGFLRQYKGKSLSQGDSPNLKSVQILDTSHGFIDAFCVIPFSDNSLSLPFHK
jgi:hypothetical protein